MSRRAGKVAILGGGVAGLSAAWRLSEPGWRERFDAITVYQRGWRLGGKGASSRGEHGRIEEHGLHIWLGSYENAFALLRECYTELNRATTDPDSPIAHWYQALIPADNPGLADKFGETWLTWLGTHPVDDQLPGEPDSTGRELTVLAFLDRALQLLVAFTESLKSDPITGIQLTTSSHTPPPPPHPRTEAVRRAALSALMAAATAGNDTSSLTGGVLDQTLTAVRHAIDYENQPNHRRAWLLLSLVTAAVRGVIADNLVTRPQGFRAINEEEFGAWLLRHGGHPDVVDSAMVRGLYDLVFGYEEGNPDRPAVSAGLMLFLLGHVLFGYKGALFWKMSAGMGDVVIAPMYQALRRRGVEFEFFHRLDGLHLDPQHSAIERISLGRQVQLADGIDHYEPLTTVKRLAVFPDSPLLDQLVTTPDMALSDLESHFGHRNDVGTRILRRGVDFDHVVLAVAVGMVPIVASELIADRPEWREMVTHVRTVATQAFQLWLWPDETELGWPHRGSTISAYLRPFETWASMPQTLWAENWPAGEHPRSVAYFCGSLDAEWPTPLTPSDYVARYQQQVRNDVTNHVDHNLTLFFPKAFDEHGFDHKLVAGKYISVNIDPSDRYVQSVPGSDRFRLRPDESGYDNLVLAGDWTDCGMNAGCIEAAVMSGLEAANALLSRSRFHRIRGYWLP